MSNPAKKVILLGWDAAIAHRVHEYAMQGELPTLKRLMDHGVYAPNCLVPYPTITSSNWTTLATGAWPGTHGITGYSVHIPGDPLDKIHGGFDSHDYHAETLWQAAEKTGKRSIVFDWPASWPPNFQNGIVIGGGGVGVNSWRCLHEGNERPGNTLSSYQLHSTEPYPFGNTISFSEAAGWKNVEDDARVLEARLDLYYDAPPFPSANTVEPKSWYALLEDTRGAGYDRLHLSETKDLAQAFASLSPGEWTPSITQEFTTSRGVEKGAFRSKLVELSPDGECFRLYVTIINALKGWSHPESVAGQLSFDAGLPCPRDGYWPLTLEWIDTETFLEIVELQHAWVTDSTTRLLKDEDWDLFFMHCHSPDWLYHTVSERIDPATASSPEEAAEYADVERRLYVSLDRMLGQIVDAAGEETLIVVTSDHGAKATTHTFQVGKILADAGLITLKSEEKAVLNSAEVAAIDGRTVDWDKTKAFPQRVCYIYVNVKGRDPDGIVEPGQEYEEVREQIIRALYDYTDSKTGKKPIALALKREDARVMGLYGDRIGDVIYALDPAFGHEHGNFLPTAEYGVGSMKGLFVMSGPGVKRGATLDRTVWLTDIVPTICQLAELPVPKDSEGAIIYQALEKPDAMLKELQQLRKNYARVMRAFSGGEAETHRYGV